MCDSYVDEKHLLYVRILELSQEVAKVCERTFMFYIHLDHSRGRQITTFFLCLSTHFAQTSRDKYFFDVLKKYTHECQQNHI